MYVESFESFAAQAEALWRAAPLRTRYVMKYRHCDGRLVLKVTDDATCLQYKTEQQSDLKKIERLNNLFFALTATGASEVPAGGDAEMAPADAPAAAPRQGRRKG